MYILSRQQVAVMGHPASGTRPSPIRQAQLIVYETTHTRLRRRIETIDLMNRHAILRCDILQLQHEITMGKVTDLPSPAASHALKHQVLEDDSVVTAAKVVGELPLEIAPAVTYPLMETVEFQTLTLPIVGARHTLGEIAVPAAQLQETILEKQGVLHRHPVAQRHIPLQPEVNANGCTIVCLSDGLRELVEHHDDVKLSEVVALDGESLDLSGIRTAQRELEAFLDAIYGQYIPVQGIAALLEHDGGEILRPAELRGTLRKMGEESLVGGVKTLKNLLDGLRVKQLPVDAVRKVCFHALAADILAAHAVVPALKRKGVIPHKTSLPEHRVKMPRAPVAV